MESSAEVVLVVRGRVVIGLGVALLDQLFELDGSEQKYEDGGQDGEHTTRLGLEGVLPLVVHPDWLAKEVSTMKDLSEGRHFNFKL